MKLLISRDLKEQAFVFGEHPYDKTVWIECNAEGAIMPTKFNARHCLMNDGRAAIHNGLCYYHDDLLAKDIKEKKEDRKIRARRFLKLLFGFNTGGK